MKKSETYSAFLKAETLDKGGGNYRTMVVTISGVSSHEFEDGKKQRVLSFNECGQQLGLNITNWDSVAEITGKDDDDDWIGSKIELYVDKNVTFGSKKIPAIRIRKPGGGEGNGLLPVKDKVTAWAAFCAAEKAAGKDKPDPEFWKSLVAKIRESSGVSHDLFQAEHWQAVIDAMVPTDEAAPIKSDDIPF